MANPQLESYSPEGVVQRLFAERLEADATLFHLVLTQPKVEGAGLIKGLNSAGWTLSAAHATWDRSGGTFVLDGGIVAGAGPLRFEGESLEIELTAATVPVAQRIKSSEPVTLELSGAGIDAGRIQFEVEEGRIWLGDGVVVHDGLLERSVGELEWWPETGRLKCAGCPDHWWPEGWKE